MKREPFIVLPTPDGKEIIKPDEIISVYSHHQNTFVMLEDNTILEAKEGIGKVHELLDPSLFIRCHRSSIVNLFKIKRISSYCTTLLLSDGQEVPISRRNKAKFIASFENFQKKWAYKNKKKTRPKTVK